MQYTYEYQGETYTVDLTRQPDGAYLAKIGDESFRFSASQLGDGAWMLLAEGQRFPAYTASAGQERYVQFAGQQYSLTKVEPGRRKRSGGGSSGDLTAEMPGQVIDVRVVEGASVKSGDVLVVLEAMKMEIRVTAAADGTVAKLYVQPGDVVERGQLLIEVDSEE